MNVNLQVSRVFTDNMAASTRHIVNVGGTRSTKTYSILQMLIMKGIKTTTPLTISIVRKSLPSLKISVLRDFIEILHTMGLYNKVEHNKTDNNILLGNCLFEFFSIDDAQKRRGSKRDILYINEANEVTWEDYFQLSIRTTKQIILDYNPSEHFWCQERVLPREDVTMIHSTFMDNPFLSKEQKDEILRLKETDQDYWRIYGLGLEGTGKSNIYQYQIVESIPNKAKMVACGLDFGFTNDPTAVVEVWKLDNKLYFQEIIYDRGLTNSDTAKMLTEFGYDSYTEFVCDSAEPKSIEDLKRMGFYVNAAKKGPDSVLAGIDILKRHELYVTKNSTNLIKEFSLYKWRVNTDGNTINRPIDANNHALDAIRYVALNRLKAAAKSKIYIAGIGK